MRRVIVDQIEALAELNRIVARRSRSVDAVEPAALRMEPAEVGPRRGAAREERTNGSPRGEPARARSDITGMMPPAIPPRRAEAPSLSPGQAAGPAGGGGTGRPSAPLTPPPPQAPTAAPQAPPGAR